MKTNNVKRTLAQGGTAIGTMSFEFCTAGLGRLAANAGAEFIIYDMEHTGWSIETVRDLIASGDGAPIAPSTTLSHACSMSAPWVSWCLW
jgi:2-keto-3-deoxy-L-rhamnonate aldolase RhmA